MSKQLYAKNKKQLAQLIGISFPALVRLFERNDHPPQVPSKGWDLAQWQRYADNNIATWNRRQPRTSPMNERDKVLIERNRISAEREKFKLDVEMGEYVRREQAVNQEKTVQATVKQELYRALVIELPPRLEMLSAADIRRVTHARYKQIVDHMPDKIMGSKINGSNGAGH